MEHEGQSDENGLNRDFTDEILRAAAQHDTALLRDLLRGSSSGPANVRGSHQQTPLHEAIAACEPRRAGYSADVEEASANPSAPTKLPLLPEREAAAETVQFLLQNGAIWNSLDNNDETPGCIAWRLKIPDLYQIVVNAGVRTEILLNHLSELTTSRVARGVDDDESVPEGFLETTPSDDEGCTQDPAQDPLLRDNENDPVAKDVSSGAAATNQRFLSSRLHYDGNDRLVEGRKNLAVMMSWEADIMKDSATTLTSGVPASPRVLNIGHGLGIIDQAFQSMAPSSHHIIEAHCDVQTRMQASGWYSRPGIRVHKGRWQDEVPKLVEQGLLFDAIYFDTYAESYLEFKAFFCEHLPALLTDNGKFGFFNGLGADRQVCYDVYQDIVEMDLLEAGVKVTFKEIQTPSALLQNTWEGLTRSYWRLNTYRLPVVTFL